MAEEWVLRIMIAVVGLGIGAFTAAWKMRGEAAQTTANHAVVSQKVHRIEDDIIEIKVEIKDLNRKLDMFALIAKQNGHRMPPA